MTRPIRKDYIGKQTIYQLIVDLERYIDYIEDESNIEKQEMLDSIHNLVGFFDTPITRKKISGDGVDEARKIARNILTKNGIDYTGLN